ncbi:hypothetical protein TVAG_459210 [Trichomonas vaginalis G3]|uniref:Uncharacterized protein n=1 Tax=Trichomonas vaginalis (strain ATCC PRA-98 / G3) TaxID=412133 RepID=A2E6C6_TRIV3|nr:hypothetical protein TVAGG3_0394880 [Trichomonas vaginalis G3]EAY11849.1 hypothetical protein TVAG_459210 [Trichomonas vaginalis G3]KAI5534266.1 hypothetical protein TVAGG3_0394880 [Trichomonas vaginalis G3]|eukprot:XP_001324072.1 hypothetical protein [Trichomonas vaginalis G3]
MTESNQHNRIVKYINEIIEYCRQDPTRIEVAVANFNCLLTAMKLYDRAPRYFNSIFDDCDATIPLQNAPIIPLAADKPPESQNKPPVLNELEKIYGKKLKITDLQMLGSALSQNLNIKLDRDTKRSKVAMINWFATNWNVILPKIYELGLQRMDFSKAK